MYGATATKLGSSEFSCPNSLLNSDPIVEVYRVLKPGGRFLFLEHGLSPDAKVQKWQRRLNWLQRRLGDNCHLDRNVNDLVREEPFGNVGLDEFYLEQTPRTHGYIYKGMAMR